VAASTRHPGVTSLCVVKAPVRTDLTLLPFVLPDANEPGPGRKHATFAEATVFVLPNPSGRNRSYPGFAGKLPWYQKLALM